MDLEISHITRYVYEPEANAAALRLKLFPPTTASQRAINWQVTVNDEIVAPIVTDAMGDQIAQFHVYQPVETLEISAKGRVKTADLAGVLKNLPQATPSALFLRSTELTQANERIRDLAARASGDDSLSRLHALSAEVAEAVEYKSGATEPSTSASEALSSGVGVCQDQAHVFIAAARSIGIPARYVAGYLFDQSGENERADETHAWAEAFVSGLGWIGFDITHQLCPTDAYVRLSAGFDADDAAPIRGSIVGETEEVLTAEVFVQQASTQSQQ